MPSRDRVRARDNGWPNAIGTWRTGLADPGAVSVRAYSPRRVYEIIKHLQDNYGIKHILFVDDLFTASKKRTTELCELIIDNGMDITWSCASRVDVVKPETLALMKKAGCWEISFGLESGSDDLLQQMDKSASLTAKFCKLDALFRKSSTSSFETAQHWSDSTPP